jgi:hypothetical protein
MFRYDYSASDLASFRTNMHIYETTDDSPAVSITQNVLPGYYYYIKVLAIRETPASLGLPAGHMYISDPKIPVLIVATPPNNTLTYVKDNKSFIDKALIDSSLHSQASAITACSNASFTVNNNGAIINHSKSLVGTNEFAFIANVTVPSFLTSALTSTYIPENRPHWLIDPVVSLTSENLKTYDGTPIVGGFPDFSNSNLSDVNGSYLVSYMKTCSNNVSCNNLGRLIGGDGVSTFRKGVFYSYTTRITGYARCWSAIKCPINPSISISDVACTDN